MHNDFTAHRIVASAFDTCRPDAFVFTGFYTNLRFVLTYLQICESYRPDIEVIDRAEILHWPGGLDNMLKRFPGSAFSGLKNEEIEMLLYLAPRSTRNAHPIPVETATAFLAGYLAGFARLQAIFRPVYWIPSEDDVLLQKQYAPRLFYLKLQSSAESELMENLVLREDFHRFEKRILLSDRNQRDSLGWKILRDLYRNCGSALMTAEKLISADLLLEKAEQLE